MQGLSPRSASDSQQAGAPEEVLHEPGRDMDLPDLMPLLGHVSCRVRDPGVWCLWRRKGRGGWGTTAVAVQGGLTRGSRLYLLARMLVSPNLLHTGPTHPWLRDGYGARVVAAHGSAIHHKRLQVWRLKAGLHAASTQPLQHDLLAM